MNLLADYERALQSDLTGALSPVSRQAVADALIGLFRNTRKKPVDNLNARVSAYEAQIKKLAEGLELHVVSGRVVVKARGSDVRTLNELRLGSDWFEAADHITETVLAGLTR